MIETGRDRDRGFPWQESKRDRDYAEVKERDLPQIGWREWIGLPDLGIREIKAKVDTGARTSALHAFDTEVFTRRGKTMVRFNVHPLQRSARPTVAVEAELVDQRFVRNSGGKQSFRPVIETTVELLGERWPIELTLVPRDEMGFRMLLGRQAIRNRLVVDPGGSFVGGRAGSFRRGRRSRKRVVRKKRN